MTELDDIYSDDILTIAGNMPAAPRLSHPGATATAHSKLCGSTITVDVTCKEGVITGYGHSVKSCLLGQTSAAVMAANAVGSTGEELRAVARQMHAMLKEDGPPPEGHWAQLAILRPVRHFRARHTSTLLVFDAMVQALDQLDATTGGTATSAAAETGGAR